MAELTEEEKYARKAKLLKTALAEADKMDKADTAKEKSEKAKKQGEQKVAKQALAQTEKAEAGAAPVPLGSTNPT